MSDYMEWWETRKDYNESGEAAAEAERQRRCDEAADEPRALPRMTKSNAISQLMHNTLNGIEYSDNTELDLSDLEDIEAVIMFLGTKGEYFPSYIMRVERLLQTPAAARGELTKERIKIAFYKKLKKINYQGDHNAERI